MVGVFFLLICQGEGAVQGQFGAGHFCFSCLLQQPFVAGRCAVTVEPGGHMAGAAGEDGLVDACFIGLCGEAADGCVPFPGGGGAVEEEFFPGDGHTEYSATGVPPIRKSGTAFPRKVYRLSAKVYRSFFRL